MSQRMPSTNFGGKLKMPAKPAYQEFVEYIVKSLVDHSDKVKVEKIVDEMGVLLTLSVDPEDMGQVIGKAGQTAMSIRTLLKVVGAKHKARVNLKILEPEGSTRPTRTKTSETQGLEDLKL